MEPNEVGSVNTDSVAKKKKNKGKQKQDKKHHSGTKHRHKKKPRLDASGNEIIDISGEHIEDDSQDTIENSDSKNNNVSDSFDEMIEEATEAINKSGIESSDSKNNNRADSFDEMIEEATEASVKKTEEDEKKKEEEETKKKAEEDAAAKKADEDAAAKKAEETKQKIKEASQKVEEDIKKAKEASNQIVSSENTEENITYVMNHDEKVPQLHEIYSENIKNKLENTEEVDNPMSPRTPKLIFIVPYRDREQQLNFFVEHMQKIMEDYSSNTYKILYIHQKDERSFNRGAMKNIGFLYVKNMYPREYKYITLVFNDVDTMPLSKNFLNYETKKGNVKHFYGYEFTLGGIVSITGGDFENVNGYANYWSWGYEDNVLQDRVLNSGLNIDRTQFYHIMDKNILQMKDGLTRLVNRGEFDKYEKENNNKLNVDGIKTIRDLKYDFDESNNFVNVTSFNTETQENKTQTKTHDMRQGSVPFKRSIRRPRMPMFMNKR